MSQVTQTTPRPTLTACGDCWVCNAPKVVTHPDATLEHDRIDRDAREDAEFDRAEFGTPDPMTHLRDGFGLRDWLSEGPARRARCFCGESCVRRFMRTLSVDVDCDDCRDRIEAMRCAWARYLTTYEAAFAAKG